MLKWNHIMEGEPENGRAIVQVDRAHKGKNYWHCSMGLRKYDQLCTLRQLLDYNKENDLPNPDFFWIYAEDFPFPERPENVKDYT